MKTLQCSFVLFEHFFVLYEPLYSFYYVLILKYSNKSKNFPAVKLAPHVDLLAVKAENFKLLIRNQPNQPQKSKQQKFKQMQYNEFLNKSCPCKVPHSSNLFLRFIPLGT